MPKVSIPEPGTSVFITNQMHTDIRQDLCKALEELKAAEETYASLPARIRLGVLARGNKSWTQR